MKKSPILAIVLALISLSLPACNKHGDHSESEQHKIVVTTPLAKDVVVTQQYVCQIHSQCHIKVKALQGGYLEQIPVKEGQLVKKNDVLFKVIPVLYKAKLDAELAEARLAELEYKNTKKLAEGDRPVVSFTELALYEAKMEKAKAKANLAQAEMDFTKVRAPFDGIIDRQEEQHGSLVKEGDVLTTLSDNRLMWVYFNVPEARYLGYNKASKGNSDPKHPQRLKLPDARIELMLADGSKFKYDAGDTVTVESKFNNETGNGTFRADFPNPDGLLRHGMTGTIVIHRPSKNAIVIPQRATFEILDKQYVYIVDSENIVRQREIKVQNELENIFVIKSGLTVDDKIVYEGIRQVRDGQKVEYEFTAPERIIANQNHRAE